MNSFSNEVRTFFGMCLQTKTFFLHDTNKDFICDFQINFYIIWNILMGARLHLAR